MVLPSDNLDFAHCSISLNMFLRDIKDFHGTVNVQVEFYIMAATTT